MPVELYNSTGAIGAARACCVYEKGIPHLKALAKNSDYKETVYPDKKGHPYFDAYEQWKEKLEINLKQRP